MPAAPLTPEEKLRYARQIMLPQIDIAGQEKLKQARVLLVGIGGLGSPVALYLTAAGVGALGLVDFDVVDASNLQRQIVYDSGDVGRAKLRAARERLTRMNPFVQVVTHEVRLTTDNAARIVEPFDIVVDGTDNFPARHVINDVCMKAGKPFVYGSVCAFEGQASVFRGRGRPCYRCLVPEAPPPDVLPPSSALGVLGIVPGIIGVIQAAEVIKLITGQGDSLAGRLLLFDALAMQFREVLIPADPDCPVCGT